MLLGYEQDEQNVDGILKYEEICERTKVQF